MKIDLILDKIVEELKDIDGISAIVLGGSRATGTATEGSDIDIGIYYTEPFDLEAFRMAAARLDDEHRTDCITDPGEWGKWINGGGWLVIDGVPVDILFRDMQRVSACVEDCMNGNITIEYQCGHPFGFVNSIYMGEVYECKILHARTETLADLKSKLVVFPQKYKKAVIQKFFWECEFSLMCGRKGIKKQDVLYASGSLFRCAVCLVQVLYAYSEMYCLNEKGSLRRLAENTDIFQKEFYGKLESIVPVNKDNLEEAFDKMEWCMEEVKNYGGN